MSSFKDYKAALDMRDVIRGIAKKVVDKERPRARYGILVSNDEVSTALVLFPGETTPVKVNTGMFIPNTPGCLVRVERIGNDRYITDAYGSTDVFRPGSLDVRDGLSGGGGGSFTRATASYTTASLGVNGTETGTIALETGFRLITMSTSSAARVRLYGSVADLTADSTRPWGAYPAPGIGLILDYLTQEAFLAELSPFVDGYSTEVVPVANIPISITSYAGGSVTVTFEWIGTE